MSSLCVTGSLDLDILLHSFIHVSKVDYGQEEARESIGFTDNRPFSYSAKESGSNVIFIHFYARDSIEWR